ncbi:bifunctional adenosylcobinamide kinase/adenosylcobinamide-phosphate guanylyltransferase [Kineosporia sp. J2-2]|uniref:Adenosylcobinamide kinase n=1 Tax=Kineosporia corallincola TaxID=2835133 RepID=A0ABS5TIU6_9ACTN|nr:bifunctional adenosylcobinamide kinase/adenosylcobinamide-phosphate guanylyltransferase [Kineosporia corallincola]MBT0770997.1 bifunctional adenosylcobinamide kinase/adenosylcobinamide-phosphate guanylyltransferase [Kineosporia corallincola]
MRLNLTATGPAGGFPVTGCSCAVCSRAHRAGVTHGPARLESPDGWAIGLEGVEREPAAHSAGFEPLGAGVVLIRTARGLVLWAPQAGEIPGAVLDSLAPPIVDDELRAVYLGPAPDAAGSGGEMPSVACARGLARLRARGVIGPGTRCLLVGLSHHETHPARLEACLRLWGAELPGPGSGIELERDADPGHGFPPVESAARPGRGGSSGSGGRVLVLGGSGSGKSAFAEQMLSAAPEVVYLATGPKPVAEKDDSASASVEDSPTEHPEDEEWAARVRKHQQRRPDWWRTLETVEVAGPLAQDERAILLDSVGTWLSGVLDRCGAWDERPGWREQLDAEIEALLAAWRQRSAPLVAVSDEVGWSIVPSTASGRMFREELGRLNARLADASEDVFVVVAGRLLRTDA